MRIREPWSALQVLAALVAATVQTPAPAAAQADVPLQAGARGYLLKESAGSEVVEAVRTVHAGRRHLSQKISDKVIDDYARLRESDQVQEPLARLSLREREVLQLVVEGKSSAEIADILSLSPPNTHPTP